MDRRPPTPGDVRPGRSRSPRPGHHEEVSAGGLVIRGAGAAASGALIARHDRNGRLLWSLPKGHIEPGESPEDAAVREVAEETGIRGEVVALLGVIDFWFVVEGRRIHKTVHHFLLAAVGGELSDLDPEVVEVAWIPLADVRAQLAYNDERRLLDRLPELLPDAG